MKIKLRLNEKTTSLTGAYIKDTKFIGFYHLNHGCSYAKYNDCQVYVDAPILIFDCDLSDYYAFIKELYSFYLYRRNISYRPTRTPVLTLKFFFKLDANVNK